MSSSSFEELYGVAIEALDIEMAREGSRAQSSSSMSSREFLLEVVLQGQLEGNVRMDMKELKKTIGEDYAISIYMTMTRGRVLQLI